MIKLLHFLVGANGIGGKGIRTSRSAEIFDTSEELQNGATEITGWYGQWFYIHTYNTSECLTSWTWWLIYNNNLCSCVIKNKNNSNKWYYPLTDLVPSVSSRLHFIIYFYMYFT